ncbi:MAG TPA: zinc ribbon domain-containing protein [Fimbriimonadaceae bacterium]|nr:zinc ribbon domain-containing protein [Fimbriimonadaceae bacterium]
MPIYEYEPVDRDCLICSGRLEVLQGINDEPHQFCPTCGLEVRRVVSQVSFELKRGVSPDKASTRGFTTYRKAQTGTYEKLAGEGPELISKPDAAAPKKRKVVDLDGA